MSDSIPGFRAMKETEEVQIWASGPDNNHKRLHQKVHIKSTVTDSGNSPATTLRGGMALARNDSDGYDYAYDADANDGTQGVIGLLDKHLSMMDRDGTVEDKFSKVLVNGIINNIDDLIGIDKAAMAVLLRIGFTIAQAEPHGSAFGVHFRRRDFKSADYTITDDDHGKLLVATAAVNFTLPSLATVGRGFQVMLFSAQSAGNMVVTGAADTIQYGDAAGAASTTLTFSTANKIRGGQVLMYSDYVSAGGALGWYPLFLSTAVTSA